MDWGVVVLAVVGIVGDDESITMRSETKQSNVEN